MNEEMDISKNATIVFQLTEKQLDEFARRIVEQTRDSVAEEVHRRVASAFGNRLDYCSMKEACEITNKTRQTLSSWIRKGRVHPMYNGNKVLFLREEIAKEAAVVECAK